MSDFFKKFKDLEGKARDEKEVEQIVVQANEADVRKLVDGICKGKKFDITYHPRNHEDFRNFINLMERLGYGLNRIKSAGNDNNKFFYKGNWVSEYIIVKHIEDNYNKITENFVYGSGSFYTENAINFFTLLKNKKDPVTPEETKALEGIIESQNKQFILVTIPDGFIDDINAFAEKNRLGLKKAEYSRARPDLCNYDTIQKADAAARLKAKRLQEILETDCRDDLIRFPDEGGTYNFILESCGHFSGAERLRDYLMQYYFLTNYPSDLKMPIELVNYQLGISKTRDDKRIEYSGIVAAGIIERAYKIEAERGLLVI